MKMHNVPHSWPDLLELLQSWWRGDTPLGAVIMSIVMAGLRIAYFGGGGGVGLIGVDAIRGAAMRVIGNKFGRSKE
ncbi:phage holin family protein [Escherichia coli]|nr:phage holin family protein [Escherichia coli]